MKNLYLYHREKMVSTLGPGKRYAIWVQGCPHNCKGCIAKDSHSFTKGGEYVNTDSVLDEIDEVRAALTGVTISGGEPFMQAEGLCEVLRGAVERNLDVICYTGYQYEELKENENPYIREMLTYIDILIDGKYVEELNSGSYLRGSDNQRIIHLKDRYKRYEKVMNALKNRNVEFKIKDREIFIAGIPPLDFDEEMEKLMKKIYE